MCIFILSTSSKKVKCQCIRPKWGIDSEWMQPLLYMKEGETDCLLWAVKWITSAGLNNTRFEVDSKVVTDSINGTCGLASELGFILKY
jgi:hypothetical protein